jgi:hypothetical protein
VVGVPELGSQQPSAVKSFEKFLIAKMGRREQEGHNAIMTFSTQPKFPFATCTSHFALMRNLQLAP